ncbi:hypothetical protein [Paraflavitalea soli]|nr:hypothetical protein [Paraflavitalea soli]
MAWIFSPYCLRSLEQWPLFIERSGNTEASRKQCVGNTQAMRRNRVGGA